MIDSTSDLSPLGKGSVARPEGGNASLKTIAFDASGSALHLESRFWITSIQTDLELAFSEARLRGGISYTPVRQQERYLTFVAQFKAHGSNYDLLSRRIRSHWRANLNTGSNDPMVFTYYGAGRSWLGFVEEVSHSAAVKDVLNEREFRMRIINRDASAESASVVKSGPYVPSRGDVHSAWEGWYSSDELAREAADLLAVDPTPTPAPTDPLQGPAPRPLFGPPTAADL